MRPLGWIVLGGALLACTEGDGAGVVADTDGEAATVVALGAAGESCTARADCETGLACVDNRCTDRGASPRPNPDGGTEEAEPLPDPGGKVGESCTRRADCQAGLPCLDNVCQDPDDLGDMPDGMPPVTRGDRGESCMARNDCNSGLACISQRCVENEFDVSVEPKQCVRVQCMEDADCCEAFRPPVNCPMWQSQCDMGVTNSCTIFESNCICQLACQDQACVRVNRCETDLDCGGGGIVRCLDGTCTQCRAPADCPNEDDLCIAGVCRAGCERNEQCPLFHECQAGQCVEVGCTSDRQCLFSTRDPRSRCQDGQCVAPCQNDAECSDFHACEDERCVFVGCEADEECRVFLMLQNVPDSTRAVCRENP
ncbi:MAG: hypothetical protein OXU20_06315 [Myxococcales bacterium]|nr:hypothetical protein [Myxococcales bacterium]MDD9967549.1 hypothetical protein [Myxococcales bacterium]